MLLITDCDFRNVLWFLNGNFVLWFLNVNFGSWFLNFWLLKNIRSFDEKYVLKK